MPDAQNSDERFVARSSSNGTTTAQVGIGLVMLVCAAVTAVNLVWLIFADDRGARLIWVIAFTLATAAGIVGLRWARAHEYVELNVDASGVSVNRRNRTEKFPWSDIAGLAVLRGGGLSGRSLVIEGPKSVEAAQRLKRSTAVTKATSGVLPLATVIGLRYLNVDEAHVLDAIRSFSGGRFPDPERQLLKGRSGPF
jgi:hypothetical protein